MTEGVEILSRSLGAVERVVVKLGSSTLAAVDLDVLAAEIARHRAAGLQIALVTSGAVASGLVRLGLPERPHDIARVQAIAAVGQVDLMARYRAAFERLGVVCAQVLITHEALAERRHFLNVRHTLSELFELGVVPIINENDTVATEELRFGDNDRLAAAIATVLDADLVILLSDIDALYDADPREDPTARPIHEVPQIDDAVRGVAGRAGSDVGTGGMVSKIEAAEIAVEAGIALVIASGDDPGVIGRVLAGERVGTLFRPNADRLDRRRHWIGFLSRLKGSVRVDAGAVRALKERGSSLLPIGVVGVEGLFVRGDGVTVLGPDGEVVARGLVGYDHDTLARIMGLRSDAIAALLDRTGVDPVIHRNDLVLGGPNPRHPEHPEQVTLPIEEES